MTSSSHHRVVISTFAVCIVEPGGCVVVVCVEVYPSNADACVPSSGDMDLNRLASPPPDAIGPFPSLPTSNVVSRLCNSKYTPG